VEHLGQQVEEVSRFFIEKIKYNEKFTLSDE